MFTDVYDVMPPHLVEQQQELKNHLDQYGYNYALSKHIE